MPSNPSTPSHPHSTSITTTTTGTMAQVQAGVEEMKLTNNAPVIDHSPSPPALPSSLTPAPVTVVRTPSQTEAISGTIPTTQFPAATSSQSLPMQSSATGSSLQHGLEAAHQLNVTGQHPPSSTAYRKTNAEFSAVSTTTQAQVYAGVTQYGQAGVMQQLAGISTNAPFQTSMHPSPNVVPSALSSNAAVSGYGVSPTTQQSGDSFITQSSLPASIPATTAVPSPFSSPMSLPNQAPRGAYPSPVPLTVSGLPTLPQSVSFPTVPPKISLTPGTNFQTIPATTTT